MQIDDEVPPEFAKQSPLAQNLSKQPCEELLQLKASSQYTKLPSTAH